jgi:hypothetical protein
MPTCGMKGSKRKSESEREKEFNLKFIKGKKRT